MISPFARKGYIDNTQLDFTSVLKFIEANWNLQPLAARDASANNFLSAFDFNQVVRVPEFLSATPAESVAPRKAPPFVIFSTYGLVLLLTFLVIGIAQVRTHQSSISVKE